MGPDGLLPVQANQSLSANDADDRRQRLCEGYPVEFMISVLRIAGGGRLYDLKEPTTLMQFTGQPLITATRFEREALQGADGRETASTPCRSIWREEAGGRSKSMLRM